MTHIPFFRGQEIGGTWQYGYFCWKDSTKAYLNWIFGVEPFQIEVKLDSLSMSTGLYDADETMIFDGDILQCGDRKVLVYWNDEDFCWDTELLSDDRDEIWKWRSSGTSSLGWVAAEVPVLGEMKTKIIGNKWENPEMLNEEETFEGGEF
jgi:uncharacterized phage protein (TIGR01671 family)